MRVCGAPSPGRCKVGKVVRSDLSKWGVFRGPGVGGVATPLAANGALLGEPGNWRARQPDQHDDHPLAGTVHGS